MKKNITIIFWIIMISCSSDEILKHPLDKSEVRTLILDNGLKVYLLSDPNFNVSAASVSVEVGSLDNPDDRQGLAHFLEHMLFLGTKKFPDVDEYSSYLRTNGGYANAYTSSDHTNYQFQVLPDGFNGALDRFSQFFISPLFTEEYTSREVNAVNSEHQKNIMNDNWRQYRIGSQFSKNGHPVQKFGTGNLETLENIDRNELLGFYKKHYSANRMGLALLSTHTLDQMEGWCREYFSLIKNFNLERNVYDPEFFEKKETFRLVQVDPIKDVRNLNIMFALPGSRHLYKSKPGRQFGFILGHEGAGSLLSYLKENGWAQSLSAGASSTTSDFGMANIRIGLTKKGLDQYKEVLKATMDYIALMKDRGYQRHVFNELKSMAKLDETYASKGEGMWRATQLANEVMQYPIEDAGRINYLYQDDTPKDYIDLLSNITADNMLTMLIAKDLPTDSIEHFYQAPYSYQEDEDFYKQLLLTSHRNEFSIPDANPFIPKNATVPKREIADNVFPEILSDNKGVKLYFGEDHEFLRPKGVISLKVLFPKATMDIGHRVYSKLYTACVNESLNEISYPAKQAGLNYSIKEGYEGIYIDVNGYKESAMELYNLILDHLVDFNITENQFIAIKDKIIRDYENFSLSDAHQQTREMSPDILWQTKYTWEESLPVANSSTLNSVKEYSKQLYKNTFIEALVYGDFKKNDAQTVIKFFQNKTETEGIERKNAFDLEFLVMNKSENIQYTKKLLVNNSCFFREYMVGKDSPELRAAVKVISTALQQPFYTEMRTNQQLGYIVWSYPSTKDENHYLSFLIQSGVYPADELNKRADKFLSSASNIFNKMDEETFKQLIKSEIEKLEKSPMSISERASKLKTLIFEHNADYLRDKKTIIALKNLNKDYLTTLLSEIIGPDTRKMVNVLTFADNHENKADVKTTFSDLKKWKKSRIYQ